MFSSFWIVFSESVWYDLFVKKQRSVIAIVKVIMGLKGSGKTKKLVDLVCDAVKEENGDVVVIEKDKKLTFDIPYQARLINAGAYPIGTYEFLKGCICGLHSGNYDITHVFIDNSLKLVSDTSPDAMTEFLEWLEQFSESEGIDFVLSVTMDIAECPEGIKKYLCD